MFDHRMGVHQLNQWQAFIFDFDGVLADSVEVKTRAFAKLYEPYGQDVVDKVVEHHRSNGGMNRFDKFRIYHGEFLSQPIGDDGVENLAMDFSSIVVNEVVASPEIPGAHRFLKTYCNIVPCFIDSATPEDELHEIVLRRGLTSCFKDMLGAPSSKADNLKIILDRYRLESHCCLFFGDTVSDYRAALEHKVKFVGIVPAEDAPLLKQAPNILWKRDFYEVEKWLSSTT